MALGMYTVVPVPNLWQDKLFPLVMPMFPMVGGVIGAIWLGLALLVTALGLPIAISAALLCLAPMALSGFIHMDGLMDTCDSVFSRAELTKRRQILKDSHIGAFAAIGLGSWLLISFSALYSGLQEKSPLIILLFIPVVSRSLSGLMLLNGKPIWDTGYAVSFKQGTGKVHSIALALLGVLGLGLCVFFAGLSGLWVMLALLIGGSLAAAFSMNELKGISGDLCGFILCVSELCALIAWSIV